MEKELEKAIDLRKDGYYEESNEILTNMVERFSDSSSINYQCAWSFDLLGEEAKAVPFYEKAIQLGLTSEELEGALIGLGSTYRTLGEYEKSKRVFLRGIEEFPENRAMKTFYSMTLYNLKEHSKAMELLLKCLIETTNDPEIINYKSIRNIINYKLLEDLCVPCMSGP